MIKTIAVHAGHNCAKAKTACGAIGFHNESAVARKITKYCRNRLQKLGFKTPYCNVNYASDVRTNLYEIVSKTNATNAKLSVSIHLNASQYETANGCEVYVTPLHSNDIIYKTAKKVVNNLYRLGFTNRGVKTTNSLYVLNHTTMPAMLVECYFCTNKKDCEKSTPKSIGYAIADAIAEYMNC